MTSSPGAAPTHQTTALPLALEATPGKRAEEPDAVRLCSGAHPVLASNRAARIPPLRRLQTAMANAKRLFDAGVLLAAGTDAPYPGDYFGEGLHRELELLVEAGLTPLQAIGLATKNAARLMHGEATWGTLEAGKRADLVLVRGNPAQRIGDSRNVTAVIQAGRMIDLRRLAREIATAPDFHPAGSTAK